MKLFVRFCKDMNITTKEQLSNFTFEEIPSEYKYKYKYGASDEIRASDDPDNTQIINAIYIILWGEFFDIRDKKDVGS
ncbi:MAG: hypothetical protein E7249_02075 [Paenibacillaceae bacterium]|nr:hypothetical protein [Paenibacillaceae bacterium]